MEGKRKKWGRKSKQPTSRGKVGGADQYRNNAKNYFVLIICQFFFLLLLSFGADFYSRFWGLSSSNFTSPLCTSKWEGLRLKIRNFFKKGPHPNIIEEVQYIANIRPTIRNIAITWWKMIFFAIRRSDTDGLEVLSPDFKETRKMHQLRFGNEFFSLANTYCDINIRLIFIWFQGLIATPFLNFMPLTNWAMTKYSLENVSWVQNIQPSSMFIFPPAFYVGYFIMPSYDTPLDTYVNLSGWGKVSEH